MAYVDFGPFGFDRGMELEGELVDVFDLQHGRLLILFDENHGYRAGIRQCLRNAVKLIDAGIVDFVGVEGFCGSLRPVVELEWRKLGFGSLEKVRGRFMRWGGSEKALIDSSYSFARALTLLRPDVPVYGIENETAYQRAGQAIRQWDRTVDERAAKTLVNTLAARNCLHDGTVEGIHLCLDSPDFVADLLSRSARETMEFIRENVQAERPRHFVNNLLEYRAELGSKRASILNAGRMDQDAVSADIRRRGLAPFVRLRPRGFPHHPYGEESHGIG